MCEKKKSFSSMWSPAVDRVDEKKKMFGFSVREEKKNTRDKRKSARGKVQFNVDTWIKATPLPVGIQ